MAEDTESTDQKHLPGFLQGLPQVLAPDAEAATFGCLNLGNHKCTSLGAILSY